MSETITSVPEPLKSESMTEIVMVNPAAKSLDDSIDLKEILTQIELNYIQDALQKCNGVVSHAAIKLGLRRTTLIEKMKKYNI